MPGNKLLFIGDSLIEFYDWQRRFPAHAVANLGMAGETVGGLLHRLGSLNIQTMAPDLVILMIGTNNIAREDYAFIPDYERIITSLAGTCPETWLVITSLLPLRLPWLAGNAIPRLNAALQKICRHRQLLYLNVFDLFITSEAAGDGSCFLADGVHLSALGYRVWSAAVEELLRKGATFS